MTLHPQAKMFLDQLAAVSKGAPAIDQLTAEQYRMISAQMFSQTGGPPEEVAHVENVMILVDDGEINVRIYTPEGEGPFPVFVYLHGGGWVIGDLDVVDSTVRALTNASESIVVSIGYRRAPEFKFPTAPEDCYAALKWVAENISRYNGDPSFIAIGGDSAGGNLSAAVTLMAKDRGGPSIAYQVLIYPATNFAWNTPSMEENGEGYLLDKATIDWFTKHYLSEKDKTSPYASPILAKDLSGLPPALIITAQYDPLRDDGVLYADRLREAGVNVELSNYEGMIHAFFWMAGVMDAGREAIEQIGKAIKKNYTSEK